jgi:hypothetical protein
LRSAARGSVVGRKVATLKKRVLSWALSNTSRSANGQVEEDTRFAETEPGFRVGYKTVEGGDKEITDFYIERLRAARDAYEQAIDYLKKRAEATSALQSARTSIK